jgi:hypothetical protein
MALIESRSPEAPISDKEEKQEHCSGSRPGLMTQRLDNRVEGDVRRLDSRIQNNDRRGQIAAYGHGDDEGDECEPKPGR